MCQAWRRAIGVKVPTPPVFVEPKVRRRARASSRGWVWRRSVAKGPPQARATMGERPTPIILSYMCNFECDHCFLYCSPRSKGTFTINRVKDVLKELQKIRTISDVCFEGREPFLFHPLLLECIRLANNKGFKTAIETNTYWATTEEDAEPDQFVRIAKKSSGLTFGIIIVYFIFNYGI